MRCHAALWRVPHSLTPLYIIKGGIGIIIYCKVTPKYLKSMKKCGYFDFFRKKLRKYLQFKKKSLPLHSQSRNDCYDKNIGIWCNGNTTDSGPVILGSSPSIPTSY